MKASILSLTPVISRAMHSQPGGESDGTVEFMPLLCDRGHRRVASDHRHDPLVEIMERRSRPTPDLGQDIFRGPRSALLGQNARGLRGHAFAARRVITEDLAQCKFPIL